MLAGHSSFQQPEDEPERDINSLLFADFGCLMMFERVADFWRLVLVRLPIWEFFL
jgi:hypothetical protein